MSNDFDMNDNKMKAFKDAFDKTETGNSLVESLKNYDLQHKHMSDQIKELSKDKRTNRRNRKKQYEKYSNALNDYVMNQFLAELKINKGSFYDVKQDKSHDETQSVADVKRQDSDSVESSNSANDKVNNQIHTSGSEQSVADVERQDSDSSDDDSEPLF